MDFLLGFDADHCLLCNEILNNTALFHSTVFVLGANYMHVPKTEQLGPDRPGMMWLKTEAINKIIPQLASQDSESARSGTLATAIALLAASELVSSTLNIGQHGPNARRRDTAREKSPSCTRAHYKIWST